MRLKSSIGELESSTGPLEFKVAIAPIDKKIENRYIKLLKYAKRKRIRKELDKLKSTHPRTFPITKPIMWIYYNIIFKSYEPKIN